jgi:hypothetical protein
MNILEAYDLTGSLKSRPRYQGQRPFLEQRDGLVHEDC